MLEAVIQNLTDLKKEIKSYHGKTNIIADKCGGGNDCWRVLTMGFPIMKLILINDGSEQYLSKPSS